MNEAIKWLTDNKELVLTAAGVLYELIVRIKPTAKDWSLVNLLKKAIDLVPNKKTSGEVH